MKIRAMILAMLATLSLSLGAQAGDKVEVFVGPLQVVDTLDNLTSGTTLVNDTLGPFVSQAFGMSKDWTQLGVRIFQTAVDTLFEDDSLYITLEVKADDPFDSIWHQLAITALTPVADFNAGEALFIPLAADTVIRGDLYRYQFYWIVDIDTIRVHGAGGVLTPGMRFTAYTMSQLR